MNPFENIYEVHFLTPTSWHVSIIQMEIVIQIIKTMQFEQDSMKDCMQRALTKDYANQNKSFREFKVGDMELKRLGRWFMD
jgi:hypothetical protein